MESSTGVGVANGRPLYSIPAPGANARQIQIAPDESLWILGNKQLTHYSPSGSMIENFDLHAITTAEPKYFVVDQIGGSIWFAGEKELIQVDLVSAQHVLRRIALAEPVLGLVTQSTTGAIWVLGQDRLVMVELTGTIGRNVDLKGQAFTGVDTLVFDAVADCAWVTHKTGVARFLASTGQLLARIGTQKSAEEVGIVPFAVLPQLSLIQPQNGLLTNNPVPIFALQYRALCDGQPCGFTNAYLSTYVLNATINSQMVGNLFGFELATGKAAFTPASRLPEGVNTFAAQVRDRFGHFSDTVSSTFTVDTVPPSFLALDPIAPFITNQTPMHITGRLSEPATLRIGLVAVPVAANGSFNYHQALTEEANSVVLVAHDLAGNQATRTLAITLDTVAPTFVDLKPVAGTLTNLSSIAITGKLSEVATLTLGADLLPLANDRSFAKTVPLMEGMNTFALTAIDRASNVTSRTINIIRDTIAPKLLNVNPANATAVSTAQVRISGAFDDATSVTLTGNSGAQTGNGAAFAFDVTLQSGANVFALRAIDGAGNVTQENLTFTWVAYDPIDAPYMSAWDGMNDALKAGNVNLALTYLTSGAQVKYRPIFEALIGDMPAIIASYSKPSRGHLSEDTAEYAIMRYVEAENDYEVFFIYFVKLADGTGLIETM